jgi:hypothetical protein
MVRLKEIPDKAYHSQMKRDRVRQKSISFTN